MDEPTYIVCALTTSPVYAEGSVERWCSICAVAVWMSRSSVKFHAESDASPICVDCARGLAAIETETPSFDVVPGSDNEPGAEMTPAERAAALRAARAMIRPPGSDDFRVLGDAMFTRCCRADGCTEPPRSTSGLCRRHEKSARLVKSANPLTTGQAMPDDDRATIIRLHRQFKSTAAIARTTGYHEETVGKVIRTARRRQEG